MEVFPDLTAEPRGFPDEVAAVSGPVLQFEEHGRPDHGDEPESVHGGVVDRLEVGVVGLVTGVDGLAELVGGQGVDEADLEAGLGEGSFHDRVIASGAFDDDDEVEEVMLLDGLLDGLDGGGEVQGAWRGWREG